MNIHLFKIRIIKNQRIYSEHCSVPINVVHYRQWPVGAVYHQTPMMVYGPPLYPVSYPAQQQVATVPASFNTATQRDSNWIESKDRVYSRLLYAEEFLTVRQTDPRSDGTMTPYYINANKKHIYATRNENSSFGFTLILRSRDLGIFHTYHMLAVYFI